MITQDQLKSLLHYDPDTGVFTWIKGGRGTKVGDIAGTPHNQGYISIRVMKKTYLAHRLACLYIYGEFPPGDVDHINRIRSDNRISNLRPATRSQNNMNTGIHVSNKSGYRGVTFYKKLSKWKATISRNNRTIHLGYFATPELAYEAYKGAASVSLGSFSVSL